MRANIKLSPWLPFVFIVITVLLLLSEFNALDIIMISGVGLIVLYVIVGFIKRKDALVIEGDVMKVTSPIKTKEYNIKDLTSVSLVDYNTLIKGEYQGEYIKLITNIYDKSLEEIKEYIVHHYEHITDKSK